VPAWFTYGPGIPTYLAIWVLLAPPLAVVLLALRMHPATAAVVMATTVPTLFLHNPPSWLPTIVRYLLLCGSLAAPAAWLAVQVRRDGPPDGPPRRVAWPAIAALAVLALAVRAPLAWLDPGVSDFAKSTETAARQLLAGQNPYLLVNEYATVGTYQYPVGTVLAVLPFVAALPRQASGQEWLAAHAALWTWEVAAVVLLATGAARLGHARGGLVAATAYALSPTLVRESGIVGANDLILALLVAAAAVALTRDRRLAAAGLVGLAVSVKPPAFVLVPLLLVAAGPVAAAVTVAIPVVLQLPLLLWPAPGWHGLWAMAEPAARLSPPEWELSVWWPLYESAGLSPGLVRGVAVTGVAAGVVVAVWGGLCLRAGPSLTRVAAAMALPLLVVFLLAGTQRHNYQDWYLTSFLLAAGVVGATAACGTARGRLEQDGSR
jgi:hypothetical protein